MKIAIWALIVVVVLAVLLVGGMIVLSGDAGFLFNRHG